jgi:hypothetical protein
MIYFLEERIVEKIDILLMNNIFCWKKKRMIFCCKKKRMIVCWKKEKNIKSIYKKINK